MTSDVNSSCVGFCAGSRRVGDFDVAVGGVDDATSTPLLSLSPPPLPTTVSSSSSAPSDATTSRSVATSSYNCSFRAIASMPRMRRTSSTSGFSSNARISHHSDASSRGGTVDSPISSNAKMSLIVHRLLRDED
jgi:hypothetical protein